jgi:hypothetical protein
MAAHIRNVRLMGLKAAGATQLPEKLDADTVTKEHWR